MESAKILSSDLLDIIFEDRNKDYGAYNLRITYNKRIVRSLVITLTAVLFVWVCTAWISSKRPSTGERVRFTSLEISSIKETEKKVEPPKPIQKTKPPQIRMRIFTPPVIKPNDEVEKPTPPVEDLEGFKIGDENKTGIEDIGIPDETAVDNDRGIIEKKPPKEDNHIHETVEVQASFPGGDAKWRRYLEQNCNGQVANDNGAPPGTYMTMLQFVVDKDGTISDVKALTSHGYGMEEEAIRTIKKGPKWNPAIQNGYPVKAYRKQPITFQVSGE